MKKMYGYVWLCRAMYGYGELCMAMYGIGIVKINIDKTKVFRLNATEKRLPFILQSSQ